MRFDGSAKRDCSRAYDDQFRHWEESCSTRREASELANSPNFSLEIETLPRLERYRYAVSSSGLENFCRPIRFAARYRASPALNFLPFGTTVSPAAE